MFFRFLGIALLALTVGCAPTTKQPVISDQQAQKEAEIQRQMAKKWSEKSETKAVHRKTEYLGRGLDVWYRITTANAPLCGKVVHSTIGAYLAVAPKSPTAKDDIFSKTYNLSPDHPTVLIIADDSPAIKAGLKPGDRILKADGENVSSPSFASQHVAGTPVRLDILRKGKTIHRAIKPEQACAYGLTITLKDTINAYADGQKVVIFSGIMDFAEKEEELALVMSHELAHNTMSHIQKKQGNSALGTIFGAILEQATGLSGFGKIGSQIGGGAYSQGFEGEADYVGVYYAARAGYDVSNAANIWRRMGAANPESIDLAGSSHPSSAKRFLAIEQTANEIARKKLNKIPLIPDLLDANK